MIAGHETSSNTSAWAMHLLATHPEVRTINPNPNPNPKLATHSEVQPRTIGVRSARQGLP